MDELNKMIEDVAYKTFEKQDNKCEKSLKIMRYNIFKKYALQEDLDGIIESIKYSEEKTFEAGKEKNEAKSSYIGALSGTLNIMAEVTKYVKEDNEEDLKKIYNELQRELELFKKNVLD